MAKGHNMHPTIKSMSPSQRAARYKTLQQPTPDASQDSLFYTLPPELRNRIYHLVLVNEDYIDVAISSTVTRTILRSKEAIRKSKAVINEPPLLRTCVLVASEATRLYYARNKFHCRSPKKLQSWLPNLDQKKQLMIMDLRIPGSHGMQPNTIQMWTKLSHDLNGLLSAYTGRGIKIGRGVLRMDPKGDRREDAMNLWEVEDQIDPKEHSEYCRFLKDRNA